MFNNPMYYNNPYNFNPINTSNFAKGRLLSMFPRHINWSNLLNNTQKTLNVINQAIPVYYQVKPIIGNAKTMFRMVNALKDDDKDINQSIKKETSTGPVFFL